MTLILIDDKELEFLTTYEQLTPEDNVKLIENKAIFEKYCRIRIRQIALQLMNFEFIDREKEAYNAINTINELLKGIGAQVVEYKTYIDNIEKAKEELEHTETKQTLDEQSRKHMEEVAKIKQKYKI